MKITAIETIRLEEFANLLWLRVHTDGGLVGLGETFFLAETIESYVHESIAPKLLGRDPLAIDRIAKDLTNYVGFRSTGAEVASASAPTTPAPAPLTCARPRASTRQTGGWAQTANTTISMPF
jgi:galactonate dehydratase